MVQVKKKTTRRYAAATFPMLVLALGGGAVMMGDKAILQGLVPTELPEKEIYRQQHTGVIQDEYEKRVKRWWKLKDQLLICKAFSNVCNENGLLPRLMASVASGAKMRATVMHIGGGPLSIIALICAAVGILLTEKLNKLRLGRWTSNKNKGEETTTSSDASNSTQDTLSNVTSKPSDVEEQKMPLIQRKDSKDTKASSLYLPEKSDTQDCLESPVVPSIIKQMSNNYMTYLSGTSFTWTKPVESYKIFIALLLFVELNDLMAPEQTVMYTPELIALQKAKPDPREYVPYMADYLTPSLTYDTANLWFQRLKFVRSVLVTSWLAYLVLPPKRMGGIAYVVGAVLYCYLATIGLMYNLGHSMQGGILFILCSIFAVPFLGCPKYGERSARWLRRFLYVGVLVPIYLFSGVSKFRYKGFWPQFTGSWMLSAFTKGGIKRSVSPTLYKFIRDRNWAMAFFSWGNVVIEYLLPLAVVVWIENPIVLGLFHFSSIIFHISIFVLMGPNFTRYCLMHMLAWNPLGGFGFKKQQVSTNPAVTPIGPVTWLDKVRAGFTAYCMIAWFYVQFISDIEHLLGKIDFMSRRNPYFPFPELSMFAKPKHPNYTCAMILMLISLACYVLVFFTRWSIARDSTETDFWYWVPFSQNFRGTNEQRRGTMVIPIGQEELALAAKNGQTFVVYDGALSASSLPKRDSRTVVYVVE